MKLKYVKYFVFSIAGIVAVSFFSGLISKILLLSFVMGWNCVK